MIALLAVRAVLSRIPAWAWCVLAGLAVVGGSYHMGRSHERKLADAEMVEYKNKQVIQTVKIVKGETQAVIKTEIEYRDKIKKIYIQGAEIEKHITDYVQPVDDVRFAVNAGFLRDIDAAWAGVPVGPAVDSDREPSGIPISAIAAVEAGNATSCLAWREQALGWREFYHDQQVVINGAAGAWYQPTQGEVR